MNSEPEYKQVLELLLKHDYYYDEESDLPYPTIKQLSESTNVKYDRVRKQIVQIYNELILDYGSEKSLKIIKTEHQFSIKSYDKYLTRSVVGLHVVPKVGDNIELPYFNAYLESRYFYVDEIFHRFEDQTHIIDIKLKQGLYNLYWHLRKDEAEEKREISFHGIINLYDFQLKEKLGL